MKYFAKIESNEVKEIIVISDSDCNGLDFPDSEPIGKVYIASLGIVGEWLQTSENDLFRCRYACVGGSYNSELDCFVNPKPFASWSLDETGDWIPPTPKPEYIAEHDYIVWNEETLSWTYISAIWNEEMQMWVIPDVG